MRAIIGIDDLGHYKLALNQLGRMGFPSVELNLIHVDLPIGMSIPETVAWTPEVFEAQQGLDKEGLTEAEKLASEFGMNVKCMETRIGSPAGILLDEADEIHADLVVVGSTQKSRFGCFFFGSVGRALAIGSPKSVLISKGRPVKSGKLRAIFATDHSEYAERAVLKLARMKPYGFEEILLVTALDHQMLAGASPEEVETMTKYMTAKSVNTVRHLTDAGIPADYVVVNSELAPAIEGNMKMRNADLLIMGAQGHGFVERLFIGSAALHQVVMTDHSILILRA